MKNKSAKKMLNNNGLSIEPCGTPKTISNQELKPYAYVLQSVVRDRGNQMS